MVGQPMETAAYFQKQLGYKGLCHVDIGKLVVTHAYFCSANDQNNSLLMRSLGAKRSCGCTT